MKKELGYSNQANTLATLQMSTRGNEVNNAVIIFIQSYLGILGGVHWTPTLFASSHNTMMDFFQFI